MGVTTPCCSQTSGKASISPQWKGKEPTLLCATPRPGQPTDQTSHCEQNVTLPCQPSSRYRHTWKKSDPLCRQVVRAGHGLAMEGSLGFCSLQGAVPILLDSPVLVDGSDRLAHLTKACLLDLCSADGYLLLGLQHCQPAAFKALALGSLLRIRANTRYPP